MGRGFGPASLLMERAMKFIFTGQYTNGRESMTICGHEFFGREPTDVEGERHIASLRNHPEFREVRPKAPKVEKQEKAED
jgi:hypothetical protein